MNNIQMNPAPAPGRPRQAMPPVEIPKKKPSWFLLVMGAFAALVLLGLMIGMWRTASAPQPVIDAPETRPPAQTAPQSPSELQR